jgi:activator of HSP90 ATPase
MTASAIDSCIHQEVDLNASPARVFEILLDQEQFSACTGAAADIQREAGGSFVLFGGRVTGRTVELIPDQRIVQAWRVETWPSGTYSIVRFELSTNDSGSRLVLDHTGFPPEDREALTGNWSRMYWNPLRTYLDS